MEAVQSLERETVASFSRTRKQLKVGTCVFFFLLFTSGAIFPYLFKQRVLNRRTSFRDYCLHTSVIHFLLRIVEMLKTVYQKNSQIFTCLVYLLSKLLLSYDLCIIMILINYSNYRSSDTIFWNFCGISVFTNFNVVSKLMHLLINELILEILNPMHTHDLS